ncbi:MAG: hypothetical protein L6R38_002479 [Xanthoria sp. 2 TBL-2021]|nr:MAG: hypothetical protein L6R38_002479 [Xanthoria sp. 2 TBL-2021]
MDIRNSHPSKSPTPSGRALTNEAVVDTGLVSTRIDAFRKGIAKSGDSHPSYPFLFPRTRFERVQTHGDWPSYNADLYNQPHARTMSLAPTSTLERGNQPQREQREGDKHAELQVKESRSCKPGVTGLKHLWESKRQSQIADSALQHTSATSSPTTPSVGEWNPPYVEDHRTRTRELPNSLPSRTPELVAEDVSSSSRKGKGSSDRSEQSLEADSSKLSSCSRSSIRHPKSIAIPVMKIRSLPSRHLPSRGSNRTDQSSEGAFEVQDQRNAPLAFSTDADSCRPNTRPTSSTRSTPPSSTPRRGWLMESRIPPGFDPQRRPCGSRDQSLDQTSTTASEYHSMDVTEPLMSAQTQNNLSRDDKDSVAETARILQYDDRNPAAPRLSGTRDAATQTDLLNERDLEETSSLWSESGSVAERQGRHLSHHRSSKPVRLERRLGRRPGIRKVQVIVSLDGATDLVMDARLKWKRKKGGSRS